jgi:hypothetical protein
VHLSRARGLNRKLAAAWWTLGAAQMDGLLDEAESNAKEALRIQVSSNARGTLALILMQAESWAKWSRFISVV